MTFRADCFASIMTHRQGFGRPVVTAIAGNAYDEPLMYANLESIPAVAASSSGSAQAVPGSLIMVCCTLAGAGG
jgi:hypothetical protein